MSRSYKKNPSISDAGKWLKFIKRYSNKKIRRTKDLPDGKAFRKVIDPWDIHEYNRVGDSFQDWMREAESSYLQYVNGGSYPYARGWRTRKLQDTPPDRKEEWIEYRKVYYWK